MKTFIVLFIIAASLPADAQRVKENIRQRSVITQSQQLPDDLTNDSGKSNGRKSGVVKDGDAKRKK